MSVGMSEHAPVQTSQAPVSQTPAAGKFQLQRKCACGSYGGGAECGKCRNESYDLRRSAWNASASVPPIVHDVLSSPGQPLDMGIRDWMEPRFGHDFGNVRVHTDEKAAESAQAVNAFAYTVGRDVVFGAGRYEPRTQIGSRLLAHELTHVVQQSGRGATAAQTARAISHPGDAAEVEAESAASRVMSGEAVKIMQPPNAMLHALSLEEGLGIGGAIVGAGLLGLGIAWLAGAFDGEHFSDTELTQYLTVLATTRRIENNRNSDNKARDVVRHWTGGIAAFNIDNGFRATGGSLTGLEVKRLLIEEMLSGVTAGGDESAIITILRRSTDRQQIVNAIGRQRIWDKFDGQNRRIVEAITLTDNEFNDQVLVDHLKALSPDELADYRDNAVDPAVRARIQRILELQRITTPLDINTQVGADGAAHPVIPGFDVNVLPDTTSQQEQYRNQAFTSFGVDSGPAVPDAFEDSSGIVQSMLIPGNIRVTIQTTYGPGSDPSGRSQYGRGSTEQDVSAGQTSLRFHEGNHGLDYLEFLRATAPPQFTGQLGMTRAQWTQAAEQFRQAMDAYYERARRFTLQRTECVGGPMPAEVARQYYHDAAICTNVGGGR
jgi:hypothetical protein